MFDTRSLVAVIAAVALSGCDVFDDDDDAGPASAGGGSTETGVLLDSAVANIQYETATQSGETNSEGEFEFEDGETVVFSIGDIELPAVTGGAVVTLLDLFGTDDLSDRRVINFARLLQSLDEDADATNGIQIVDSAHSAAAGMALDFDVPAAEFETNADVLALVANGALGDLISAIDALEHLSELSLVGSWYSIDDAESDMQSSTLTFLPDGTYMSSEGTNSFPGETGNPGIEYGTYSWNPADGSFSVDVETDTDGDWGLSGEVVSLVRSGRDTLIVSWIDEDTGEPDSSSYTRAAGPDNPLVGAWVAERPDEDTVVVLVFTAEIVGFSGVARYYSWAEVGPETAGGQAGAEFGTYTWNPETGALVTVPRVDASGDTNGDWGFSGEQSGVTATLDGEALSLEFTAGGGLTLTRVE